MMLPGPDIVIAYPKGPSCPYLWFLVPIKAPKSTLRDYDIHRKTPLDATTDRVLVHTGWEGSRPLSETTASLS